MENHFALTLDELFKCKLGCVLKDGQTTMALASALMKTWISIFGPPRKLISDQDTNLARKAFAEWCDHLNIERIPGHPIAMKGF